MVMLCVLVFFFVYFPACISGRLTEPTPQDYILNYIGVEAMVWVLSIILYMSSRMLIRALQVDALQTQFTSVYKQQSFTTLTVAGQATGVFKNAGTFSYVRITGA